MMSLGQDRMFRLRTLSRTVDTTRKEYRLTLLTRTCYAAVSLGAGAVLAAAWFYGWRFGGFMASVLMIGAGLGWALTASRVARTFERYAAAHHEAMRYASGMRVEDFD